MSRQGGPVILSDIFIAVNYYHSSTGRPKWLVILPLLCFAQSLQHNTRGDGKIVYPYAYCIVHGGSG